MGHSNVSPCELLFSDNTAEPFNNVRSLDRLEMVLSDSSTTPRLADVSLIHSNSKFEPTDPDKFDLDWLFGPNDGASVSLPADLAPKRLNKLAEAQARLIGLSDNIPLEERTDFLAGPGSYPPGACNLCAIQGESLQSARK